MFNFNFFQRTKLTTTSDQLLASVVLSFDNKEPKKYMTWLVSKLHEDFFRQVTYEATAKVNQRFDNIKVTITFNTSDMDDAIELEKSIRYIAPHLNPQIILRSNNE